MKKAISSMLLIFVNTVFVKEFLVDEGVQYSRLRGAGRGFWPYFGAYVRYSRGFWAKFSAVSRFLAKLSAVLLFLAKFSAVLRFSYRYCTPP